MSEYYRTLIIETVQMISELCQVSVRWILKSLEVKPSTYYAWLQNSHKRNCSTRKHPDTILPEERKAVIDYALKHPDIRHRELTWRMIDDNVVCLSISSVYKILKDTGLICVWKPKEKRMKRSRDIPSKPDERWQSDISHIDIDGRKYYLITFIDEYSRYVTHHELMTSLDGNAVSLAAERALSKLDSEQKPVIQTDNGSGYISREFKVVLSRKGVGHHRIHPHCPEENGIVERVHRTIKDAASDYELTGHFHGISVIDKIIRYYNDERLHSSLNFLKPIDYYRGNPEKLLEERKTKILQARHKRREQNLKIKQKSLPLTEPEININHNLFQRTICPTLS